MTLRETLVMNDACRTKITRCAACSTLEPPGIKFKKCARCLGCAYCSKKCQKKDWIRHEGTGECTKESEITPERRTRDRPVSVVVHTGTQAPDQAHRDDRMVRRFLYWLGHRGNWMQSVADCMNVPGTHCRVEMWYDRNRAVGSEFFVEEVSSTELMFPEERPEDEDRYHNCGYSRIDLEGKDLGKVKQQASFHFVCMSRGRTTMLHHIVAIEWITEKENTCRPINMPQLIEIANNPPIPRRR